MLLRLSERSLIPVGACLNLAKFLIRNEVLTDFFQTWLRDTHICSSTPKHLHVNNIGSDNLNEFRRLARLEHQEIILKIKAKNETSLIVKNLAQNLVQLFV